MKNNSENLRMLCNVVLVLTVAFFMQGCGRTTRSAMKSMQSMPSKLQAACESGSPEKFLKVYAELADTMEFLHACDQDGRLNSTQKAELATTARELMPSLMNTMTGCEKLETAITAMSPAKQKDYQHRFMVQTLRMGMAAK